MSIVVLGSSNTDMIIKAPRIPRPGETILGGAFQTAAGGKGANQAVAAARAGGKVSLIACIGDDMFGRQALEGFKKDQIDIQCVRTDASAPSGVALIMVDEQGENSIAVASGANAKLSANDVRAARSVITNADVLLMQLETPVETVIAAAKMAADEGVRVLLNPAPAQKLQHELLKNISIITPNETEAELLTGIKVIDEESAAEAAHSLQNLGPQIVLITLGAMGVFVLSEHFEGLAPSFKQDAIDTTAAGDVFNGALATAIAKDVEFLEAVRFAQAAAAISVTRLGAQPSAPQKLEILELMLIE